MLHHLLFLVVASAVLFGPGLLLAGALGLHRSLPRVLLLPVALLLTQVVATAGVLLQLAFGLPIDAFAAWMALVAANFAAWWWYRARGAGLTRRALPVDDAPRESDGDDGWEDFANGAAPRRWVLLHRAGTLLPLAWLTVIGFVVGAQLKSDTLWHAAYSLKLIRESDPGFTSLGIMTDGVVPSYLVPAWHATVALAAWASATPPHVAYWLLPTLLLPVGALAYAGLARVATGRALAEPLAALAYLAVAVADGAPRFAVVDTASYPSHVVTEVALPVAIAGWLLVLWSPQPGARRGGWIALAAGLLVTVVLHGNYTPWLAMGIAGYLAGWAVVRRWPRPEVARHARAAGALLAMSLVLVGLMFIGWRSSPQLGRGANDAATESVQETFEGTFVGGAHSYRLDPAVLVPTGGVALVALLLLPLVAWRLRRLPGTWYMAGTMGVAIVASQSSWLVPKVVGGGSTSVIARLGDGLPHVLGVTLVLVALAGLLGPGRIGLMPRVAAGGAVGLLLVVVMYRLPPDPTLLPGAAVLAAGVLLVLLGAGALVRRLLGRRSAEAGAGPGVEVPAQGALLAWLALGGACLVMGAAGAGEVRGEWNRWAETSGGWAPRTAENAIGRLPNHEPTGRDPRLLADMGDLAERIPEGQLVAAPTRVVYFVAATVPVRVVVDEHVQAFDRESTAGPGVRARMVRASKACWALLPPDPIGASMAGVFTKSGRPARLVARGPAKAENARWQLWTFC